MKLRNITLIVLLFAFAYSTSFAQKVDFNSTSYPPLKKLKTINVSELDDPYLPHLQSLEAPSVSGDSYKAFLANRKKEINKIYPPSNHPIAKKRAVVSPPELIKGFPILGIQTGIPCDNHLAMNGDDIVSAGNFYMAVNNPSGGNVKKFTLDEFAQAAGITDQPFDPRLAYDPDSDRYFFTFLAGFSSGSTHIVVAFSETGDPSGNWNIYSIVGNPNNLNQWTDYPMISITNNHIFLTINLLRDGESWQLGFEETIIWQMDKTAGYAGLDINLTRIDGITFGDQNIRNLCPAESATETMYDDIYFVSNRNFSMEADSFFLIKVDPNAEPDDLVDIQFIQSDTPYGAPPNATQKVGFLQTNDARVLEAFRLGDEIQFVGNTRNLDNNLAGIYHGIIESISDPQMIKLNHIIGSDFELGYPGITYTGESSDDRDAIIAFNHTSGDRFPGVSALYSVPEEGYSEIVQMGQGNNYVDMLQNTDIERWGDYLGTQRNYADPRDVWVSGFIGVGSAFNAPFICQIRRPEVALNANEINNVESQANVFPNPFEDRTSLKINIPDQTKSLTIDLHSINGERIDMIYSSNHIKTGENSFSFNTSSLAQGTYIIKVLLDGKNYLSKTIIKM